MTVLTSGTTSLTAVSSPSVTVSSSAGGSASLSSTSSGPATFLSSSSVGDWVSLDDFLFDFPFPPVPPLPFFPFFFFPVGDVGRSSSGSGSCSTGGGALSTKKRPEYSFTQVVMYEKIYHLHVL